MLVLCSNGLSSSTLMTEIKNRAGFCQKAAVVVTADNEYKENNRHVARCIDELKNLCSIVDVLDLDKHPVKQLKDYDIVEFIGGNPYYLLNCIREHEAESVLREIADSKVLIGWSAAAFVFGPTLNLVDIYTPELNFLGITDLCGLALTNVEVLPHYDKFLKRIPCFEEKCHAYEKEYNIDVIRLNDGDGVIIDDNGNTLLIKSTFE